MIDSTLRLCVVPASISALSQPHESRVSCLMLVLALPETELRIEARRCLGSVQCVCVTWTGPTQNKCHF